MDQAASFFLELEGSQVRISTDIKVDVLEKIYNLLGKVKNLEMSQKLSMKSKVSLKSLDDNFNKVGIFYNVSDVAFKKSGQKFVETHTKYTVEDAVKMTVKNNKEDTNNESRKEDKKDKSNEILALKDLLSDSEKRLRDRKMKITSLKINLANMEKKNAEKKLSIQKRDRRIKELEETMNIREEAYKRFKEVKNKHSKGNLNSLEAGLEYKLFETELELSKNNATINRLEEENKSLRKHKSWSRSLEKELASLKFKKNSNRTKESNQNKVIASNKKSNIFEDEIEIEVPHEVEAAKDRIESTDETIESISSFLAELSDSNNESVDLEENSTHSKTHQTETLNLPFQRRSSSKTKAKTAPKSADNSAAWLALAKATKSASSASRSEKKQTTIQDYLIDKDDSSRVENKDDIVITINDDDENLIKDGEDILLETMFEDHPSFSADEEVITIQEESVKSFLILKPFATLCSKSDNIVESQKRAMVEELFEIPSKRQKMDEFLKRAMEL